MAARNYFLSPSFLNGRQYTKGLSQVRGLLRESTPGTGKLENSDSADLVVVTKSRLSFISGAELEWCMDVELL